MAGKRRISVAGKHFNYQPEGRREKGTVKGLCILPLESLKSNGKKKKRKGTLADETRGRKKRGNPKTLPKKKATRGKETQEGARLRTGPGEQSELSLHWK